MITAALLLAARAIGAVAVLTGTPWYIVQALHAPLDSR